MSARARIAADAAELRRRHPDLLRADPRRRLAAIGVVAAMAALVVAGLILIEFDPLRVLRGFGELGTMAVLMMPPDPGSWARALIYANALGETLAISFLGTFGAAIVAFPIGFLAARNVMPT